MFLVALCARGGMAGPGHLAILVSICEVPHFGPGPNQSTTVAVSGVISQNWYNVSSLEKRSM